MGATGGDGGDSGVDSRQLLLVGICIFGLIAAAFLAPVVGAGGWAVTAPAKVRARAKTVMGARGHRVNRRLVTATKAAK
ncbi:hypothetical protein ACFQER_15810 [Halomicroarcula sp. GCM10025894]|uniref:hypothetical protein n=1 Tax=Halomicroarcula sp. GCM10025894 TaxID=3252673 RepID=UPI003614E14D